jgi:hypothetical protein
MFPHIAVNAHLKNPDYKIFCECMLLELLKRFVPPIKAAFSLPRRKYFCSASM